MHPKDWPAQHPDLLLWGGAACVWLSAVLIIRLWLVHRRVSRVKKFFWSVALLVPLLGWLFYGAFFQELPSHNDAPSDHTNGGGSGEGHV